MAEVEKKVSPKLAIKMRFANRFRELLKERKLTQSDLDVAIIQYAEKLPLKSDLDRAVSRHNLRKELGRDVMTGKVFAKALAIIGFSQNEITRELA